MADNARVLAAAERLKNKDEESLLVELGMRERAIMANPALSDEPDLQITYESNLMGPLDELKRVGRRLLIRWGKAYGIVCGQEGENKEGRKKLLDSISLGEAAVIASVAGVLLSLGVAAALAAALAPLIVKKFVLPAGEELCEYWGEALTDAK